MICYRTTGGFVKMLGEVSRLEWAGEFGTPRVTCNFRAVDEDGLLCHMMATHGLTLREARQELRELRAS